MNAAELARWAALYVKDHGPNAYHSQGRKRHEKVVAQREEALRFIREHGASVRLDEIVGDPSEVTLLNRAIRGGDDELALALLAGGASPTRIYADPSRADEGPGDLYFHQRPLWLARDRNAKKLVAALATPSVLAVEAEDERQRAERTPLPGARYADVYVLSERWVFVPQSGGDGGVRIWMPGAVALERTESVARVTATLTAVLQRHAATLADADTLERAKRDVFRAARVRSHRALAAAAMPVSVAEDEEKFLLFRWRADGRGGYTSEGRPIVLKRPVSDADLVASLRRAATPHTSC